MAEVRSPEHKKQVAGGIQRHGHTKITKKEELGSLMTLIPLFCYYQFYPKVWNQYLIPNY